MRVAVLITCHDRKEKTLRCLEALLCPPLPSDLTLQAWLVDDGSTDGTSAEVARRFPEVRQIAGNGSLFWCGGMRLAWRHAAKEDPDAYLWLNDDVVLFSTGLAQLADAARDRPEAIVVGSCAWPGTRRLSYGGLCHAGAHPGKLAGIPPGDRVAPCDTFQGNIVWIPRGVFARLGPLGPFRHSMGDIDYGYRAAAAGIGRWVAPDYLGECSGNGNAGTWEDATLPRRLRWGKIRGVKGLPAKDWWRFCRRHGGARAPWFFLSPYCRVLLGR